MVLFAIYAATAQLGLSFDALGGIATTVWPPTGIALAALLLRGVGLWPAIAAAAFAVNVATGIPLWGAAIIAVGNTLEAVVGAIAAPARSGSTAALERLRDVCCWSVWRRSAAPWSARPSASLAAALGARPDRGRARRRSGRSGGWATRSATCWSRRFIFVWAAAPRLSRRPLRWIEAAAAGVLRWRS